jgi:phospholipase C
MYEEPRLKKPVFRFSLCAIAASVLAACNGGPTASTPALSRMLPNSGSGSTPISHIVLIVQENRTFNNLFAQFPGATGTIVGKGKTGKGKHAKTISIPLTEVSLEDKTNLNHLYVSYQTGYDDGKMDGFNQIIFQATGKAEGSQPYKYVNPSQIAPYWAMAETYALANAMFQTQGSGSYTAHQDLIRGGTALDGTYGSSPSLINDPTTGKGLAQIWGCDAKGNTATSLITTQGRYEGGAGPFPCSSDFPDGSASYSTLRDLMDDHAPAISWKYYTPQLAPSQPGAIWNAFDTIAPVRNGPEWGTNVNWPETNIFNDITNGKLAAVSWVIPDGANSDHPGYSSDTGPSWVASVVNAIGQSSYWNSTAIIVVWDDWGGFYDSVEPPSADDQGGPGFRVPMIVVSPYARETSSSQPGYISNTVYEFGSIVRFIEETFSLGSLGTTDQRCKSISDMFNFNQPPRTFSKISSKYSKSYFLHQKPSGLPVDTE